MCTSIRRRDRYDQLQPFLGNIEKVNRNYIQSGEEAWHLSATLDKLRHNKSVNITSLNDLCRILNCKIEDIVMITNDDDEGKLL